MPDLRDGARAMDALARALLDTKEAANRAAAGVLKKARQKASGRPTPQARMAASGMVVRGGSVIGFGSRRVFGRGNNGVKLGFIAYGAEFGSSANGRFGPRNEAGYWLHPAAEGPNPDVDKAHEDDVDDAIDDAFRVAKLGL